MKPKGRRETKVASVNSAIHKGADAPLPVDLANDPNSLVVVDLAKDPSGQGIFSKIHHMKTKGTEAIQRFIKGPTRRFA